MQLLRLEVKNWCQHKHRVCSFTRGLVAIVGKIGSGKSNLLGAICWLLTGENPNAGVKADNVSQLSGEEEPAFATLEFEHAGHIVVVTRHLLPEKEQATLLLDGTEVARGDKAVTAYVEKLLGIDSKFISRFVIVAQNEIFAFIEEGAAEVDRFFQKLFGTAVAEKCQDAIGKHINKLTIPEVVETSAQLAAKLETIDSDLSTLGGEISKLPSLESFLAIQAEQQKIVSDWTRRTGYVAELAGVERDIVESTSQLNNVKTELAQYESDLLALRTALGGDKNSHTDAKVALGHWANYKHVAAATAKAQTRLEELAKIRVVETEPAIVTPETVDNAIARAMDLQRALDKAKKFVHAFDQTGTAECPTCHTPTSNLVSALEEANKQIPELERDKDAQNELVAELIRQRDGRNAWERKIAQLDAEEKQIRESLHAFSNVQAPSMSEEESAKIVLDYETFQKAEDGISPLAAAATKKLAELEAKISATKTQQEKLKEAISALSITEAVAHMAQTVLNTLSQQCVLRQNYEKQHAELTFTRNNLYTQYLGARSDEEKAAKLRDWTQVAETAKEALKAAPRLVATRNLQRLESAINELLQVFSVDFFIRAASDGSPSFTAEFFDGRKQPARRLSYGQKTVLALAFRVAVNALFAEEIGLLALDEPTAYLDQQRIKALAPVLEKLRELSTARGLQCLLVTHETSLAHLFESTVELDVQ